MHCIAQTTHESAMVSSSPTTATIVSTTDQVLRVCTTLMLKYSFTSQKPPSLTCEKISDPAPVTQRRGSG